MRSAAEQLPPQMAHDARQARPSLWRRVLTGIRSSLGLQIRREPWHAGVTEIPVSPAGDPSGASVAAGPDAGVAVAADPAAAGADGAGELDFSAYEPTAADYAAQFIPLVKRRPSELHHLDAAYKTDEVCRAAVLARGSAIDYVPADRRTPELCLAAVQDSGLNLRFLSSNQRSDEVCIAAIENTIEALHLLRPDDMTEAVEAAARAAMEWYALLKRKEIEAIRAKTRALPLYRSRIEAVLADVTANARPASTSSPSRSTS